MSQQMLAIWSLVPLPSLNPAWTSGSSWFTYCWILAWRILSITNMWDECNSVVVWAFFYIAFLWDWNENWPFPALWPLLSLPNEYYSALKRNACDSLLMTWTNLEPIIEWSMSENLENSAVTTGLEKVSFHSSHKERQSQRMLKLPQNCTHLTH